MKFTLTDTAIELLKSRFDTAWMMNAVNKKYDVLYVFVCNTTTNKSVFEDFYDEIFFQHKVSVANNTPTEIITVEFKDICESDNEDIKQVFGHHCYDTDDFGDDWFKGHKSILNCASTLFVMQNLSSFDESYKRFQKIFHRELEGNGSAIATYKEINNMFETMPKELMLQWFSHDSHTMQRLRSSSPFTYLSYEYKKEIFEIINDIIANPDKYPPLPSYWEWVEHKIANNPDINPQNRFMPPQYRH